MLKIRNCVTKDTKSNVLLNFKVQFDENFLFDIHIVQNCYVENSELCD